MSSEKGPALTETFCPCCGDRVLLQLTGTRAGICRMLDAADGGPHLPVCLGVARREIGIDYRGRRMLLATRRAA